MIRSLTAIALAASFVSAPAFAASDTFEMDIKINKANLETIEQASAEYEKIREDVHERCVSENKTLGRRLAINIAVTRCEHQLMNKIVSRVDNDNFTAAHRASR